MGKKTSGAIPKGLVIHVPSSISSPLVFVPLLPPRESKMFLWAGEGSPWFKVLVGTTYLSLNWVYLSSIYHLIRTIRGLLWRRVQKLALCLVKIGT